ncbi:MAG: PAS domain S-box protein, partial [Chitinophagales bacterium]|nr:PAS domain S-box protein [Chitinophagales bacterium]
LTGFSAEETIGKSSFDYLRYQTDTQSFYQKVRKLISRGVQSMEHEMQVRTKNNEWKYVEVKLQTIYSENNTIKGISGVIIDIHAKKLAQIESKLTEGNLKQQNKVLMSLAKSDAIYHGDFYGALQQIAKVAAETLLASRVNIWQFSEDYGRLSCLVNYDNDRKQFAGCISFEAEQFPKYFNYLLKDRVINAADCMKDIRVSEFKQLYYEPAGIVSALDISIMMDDEVWGVICVDHRGDKRSWTYEDQAFTRSVADFISLSHVSSQRKIAQAESGKKDELYRTLIEQANDAIFILDAHDHLIDVNKRASSLMGYTKEEFLTLDPGALIPERFITTEINVLNDIRKNPDYTKERILVKKNGEEIITEISAILLEDGGIQVITRDITERKRQEKALKESETRLELALKGADLGTWDFFIQEDKLIHNKRWGELLGYNFEMNIVNESFMDKFVHPDDIDYAYKEFQKHISGETPYYEVTIRMLASNGEWRWIQDKGKVVEWDTDGKPLRASGIHQDVTALKMYEKEIQQQKTYLQQIINTIPNPIYVKNVNDEFVMVNKALADFLGTTEKTLLQYQFAQKQHISEKLKLLFDKDFEVFISRKPVLILDQQITDTETKSKRWLQSIKVPLIDSEGNNHEILSVSTDITELKVKEQELAELNETLEQKAADRTALLEIANKELETFNYSVSHDLRTPLRTIDIFAYFLEKNYKHLLDKEGSDNIVQIRQSIMKMGALIDNLLIYSKMGRVDVQLTEINVEEMVHEVIDEISKEKDGDKVQFTVTNLPALHADYAMLKQALRNLVSNAVKFTKTKMHPAIEFFGHTDPAYSTLAIRDNGVGFSMEYKDKLFKAFKRLHSEEYFEGTGVGLAIVEKIIKRHNGQIWAESEENKGTTFYIKLPNK